MKYIYRELKDNVNVSPASPLMDFFILLSGILSFLIIIYFLLGFAAGIVISKMPFEIEEKLGNLYWEKLDFKKNGMTGDAPLQELLDKLLKEFPDKRRKYDIHVVPSERVNAFALPGGHIVLFSRLINEVKSENELAFVIAHELAHFAHNDHLKGFGRGLVLMFVSAFVFGQDDSVTEFLMNSLSNMDMRFSQDQEVKADLWALDLLNKKYGQVAGAKDFLKNLEKKRKGMRVLYYFSTHPYPHVRIKALEDRIRKKRYCIKEKTPLNDAFKAYAQKYDIPTSLRQ